MTSKNSDKGISECTSISKHLNRKPDNKTQPIVSKTPDNVSNLFSHVKTVNAIKLNSGAEILNLLPGWQYQRRSHMKRGSQFLGTDAGLLICL